MKRCLLIGGAGFIGTNLGVSLYSNGYDVTLCDCVEQAGLSERLAGMKYIRMNYFEQLPDEELLRQQDMVILLISSLRPENSMTQPKDCYRKDVVRMIDLLEKMRKCNVNRLVFISSGGTVYGNQNESKLNESMATYPINHYGIMKLMQEKILLMYNELYGMCNVIFRLSNPYGEGQKMSSGIGAVTAFLHRIMHEEEICIYGEGKTIRDYIYIEDAVDMMRLCLDKGMSAGTNALYNIGTGEGHKIIDVLHLAEKIVGKKAKIVYSDKREFDVTRNVLDIARIRTIIGDYECRNLEQGMKEYYEILKS
jgi:UDP-glucose 4-epimerase